VTMEPLDAMGEYGSTARLEPQPNPDPICRQTKRTTSPIRWYWSLNGWLKAWDLSAAPVQLQPDRSPAVTDEC
jgi:hypothetical protein